MFIYIYIFTYIHTNIHFKYIYITLYGRAPSRASCSSLRQPRVPIYIYICIPIYIYMCK